MAILVWLALLTSMSQERREDQPVWSKTIVLDRRYYGVLADVLPPVVIERAPYTVGEYEAWVRSQPPFTVSVETITIPPRKLPR